MIYFRVKFYQACAVDDNLIPTGKPISLSLGVESEQEKEALELEITSIFQCISKLEAPSFSDQISPLAQKALKRFCNNVYFAREDNDSSHLSLQIDDDIVVQSLKCKRALVFA